MSQPKFVPAVSKEIHPEVQRHITLLYQKLDNHAQAFEQMKAQITALQAKVK